MAFNYAEAKSNISDAVNYGKDVITTALLQPEINKNNIHNAIIDGVSDSLNHSATKSRLDGHDTQIENLHVADDVLGKSIDSVEDDAQVAGAIGVAGAGIGTAALLHSTLKNRKISALQKLKNSIR